MHPPSVQFDEEQHVQPLEPDRVDGEEITCHDPGGLLAQEGLPGRGSPSRCRVESVAAKRRADRGCRDAHAKAQRLAPLVHGEIAALQTASEPRRLPAQRRDDP